MLAKVPEDFIITLLLFAIRLTDIAKRMFLVAQSGGCYAKMSFKIS